MCLNVEVVTFEIGVLVMRVVMVMVCVQMTLQEFIDNLFGSVFTVDATLPPAVKYLFDFLDSAAERRGLVDTDVVHAWKTNR